MACTEQWKQQAEKSLTLLSTGLRDNDNAFVHFNILESPCGLRKKYSR